MIDESLYEKSLGALNTYVSALSVVFGVYVFGFEGVVFGPLLVCGVSFVYELSEHSISSTTEGTLTPASKRKLRKKKILENSISSTTSIFGPWGMNENTSSRKSIFGSWGVNESPNSNLLSSAYRKISTEGVSFFGTSLNKRRISEEVSASVSGSGNVTMVLLWDNKKYRFVASKQWSMDIFFSSIEKSLSCPRIESIVTKEDEVIVVNVVHIQDKEVLRVLTFNPEEAGRIESDCETPTYAKKRRNRLRRTSQHYEREPRSTRVLKSPTPVGPKLRTSRSSPPFVHEDKEE